MRDKVILKALLISFGVTFVSLVAVVLYVIITALTHIDENGIAFVIGGVGGLLLKLLLIELPAVFLFALLLLHRNRPKLP
jgi:flagellar biosynthesis protein FliQ